MIAVDAGFLYAIVDRRDRWHARSRAAAANRDEGWITTWPVLAETTYLFQKRLNGDYSAALMDDVAEGGVDIWNVPPGELARIPALMRRYASLPMDLADATLFLLAEHLGHGRILSTDERDFKTYRWKHRKPFVNLLAG